MKNRIIYDYLRDVYNAQRIAFTQIDARIGNYLVIIGLLFTVSLYFIPQVIAIYSGQIFWSFIAILVLYFFTNLFLVLSLWRAISIFYVSKINIPGVNDQSLITLLEQNTKDVNEDTLISDLAYNYIEAYKDNITYAKIRKKVSASIRCFMRLSLIFLVAFLVFLFTIKIYYSEEIEASVKRQEDTKNAE